MPLPLDIVRRIADQLTRPGRFFTGRDFLLGWSHCDEEVVWEVFQGRLLDPAHSRQRRRFETWNVHQVGGGNADPLPLLSLKLDVEQGRLHVVRGVEGYVWEGYDAGGNVYQSRERRKWLRELISTFHVADFSDAGEFRQEVACALERAVMGVRLPLEPIETPLPCFSFGELFYVDGPDDCAEEHGGIQELLGRLADQREPARLIEAWLRSVAPTDLPTAAVELSARWSALGRTGDDLLRTFRRLFNDVSLSPWTDFTDKVLCLLALLQGTGTLTAEQVLDFEGYLLRQLSRHLTAYDLVMFHHRGANYPDALLLDSVLADYLARLQRDPALFEGEGGRLRRRALRQAWVVRRHYEGHPVPDVPTSPGEHARVYPAGYPRVPEQQILQVGQRRRRLYDGDPLVGRLDPVVRAVLRQSLDDLANSDERQELGAGVYLDRPFGGGKAAVEPDATLLLASLAWSRSIAATRLRVLGRDLELPDSDLAGQIENLDLPGLPLTAVGPAVRQGTLGLADAARTAADFRLIFTLPGSVAALRALLTWVPVDGEGAVEALSGRVLLARAVHGPALVVYDESGRARLEMEPCLEQGYASRRGLEYPRGGFRVKRV